MNFFQAKVKLAGISIDYGLVSLAESIQNCRMPFIRAINYHSTALAHIESFKLQLQYFAENFEIIDLQALESFLCGEMILRKPGMIISFDDGYRDNYFVARPLLNSYRIKGWFFVIAREAEKASNRGLETGPHFSEEYMNWQEIKDLKNDGHIIGSHTMSHKNVGKTSGANLTEEIIFSKRVIESNIGQGISSFCYPFGDIKSYSVESLQMLKDTYDYVFHSCPGIIRPGESCLSLGRNNIEGDWDLDLVRTVLSGLFDIKHIYRRIVYNRYLKEATRNDHKT